MLNEDASMENTKERLGRWLVDPKVDQANIWPVWRKIAKYAQVTGNNTKTAKLFWRALSIGEGDGFRNVSAGAKKVKELRFARKNGSRPFDTRLKDVPCDDYPSDYEEGMTAGLPNDDFEQCCTLSTSKSKFLKMNSSHMMISPTYKSNPIKFEGENEQNDECSDEDVLNKPRKKSRMCVGKQSTSEADDSDVDIVSLSQKVKKDSLECDLAEILLQIKTEK